jgi:hypothetical protein
MPQDRKVEPQSSELQSQVTEKKRFPKWFKVGAAVTAIVLTPGVFLAAGAVLGGVLGVGGMPIAVGVAGAVVVAGAAAATYLYVKNTRAEKLNERLEQPKTAKSVERGNEKGAATPVIAAQPKVEKPVKSVRKSTESESERNYRINNYVHNLLDVVLKENIKSFKEEKDKDKKKEIVNKIIDTIEQGNPAEGKGVVIEKLIKLTNPTIGSTTHFSSTDAHAGFAKLLNEQMEQRAGAKRKSSKVEELDKSRRKSSAVKNNPEGPTV